MQKNYKVKLDAGTCTSDKSCKRTRDQIGNTITGGATPRDWHWSHNWLRTGLDGIW